MRKSFVSVLASLAVLAVSSFALADSSVSGILRPAQSEDYSIGTRPGNRVIIWVEGTNDDADIDCYLVDDDGDVVRKDVDRTNTCSIIGTAAEVHYTLRIVNHGSARTFFRATIN